MFHSKLPVNFLGDFIATTTFIINRTPFIVLKSKSPFELLYEKLPIYSDFIVFVCLCYISTIPQHRNKFTPRAFPCVFLGYLACYKGLKVYGLVSKTFHVSRDIYFHEGTFPFHSIPENNNNFDPFHELVFPNPICDHSPHDYVPNTNTTRHDISNPTLPETNSTHNVSINQIILVLRRSCRTHITLTSLRDFVCYTPYGFTNLLSYEKLSSPCKDFIMVVSSVYEPHFYH